MTKLSRWMVEQFVADNPQKLKIDDALLHKEGVSPDEVADLVGFNSGVEMLQWLGIYPNKETYVREETGVRLRQAFDVDLLSDENIREAAVEAINNESRFESLAAELNALERLAKKKTVSLSDLKQYAKDAVDKMKIKGISSDKYLRASIKAANEAQKAFAKGKYADALEQKQKQLACLYPQM